MHQVKHGQLLVLVASDGLQFFHVVLQEDLKFLKNPLTMHALLADHILVCVP
jgi:hypothetical protein